MPDPIPELNRLASEAERVEMLPVSEIRKQGDKRRRNRRIFLGTGIAASLVIAGIGVSQTPLFHSLGSQKWASSATPSPPPHATSSVAASNSPTPTPVPSPPATVDPPPAPSLEPSNSPTHQALAPSEQQTLPPDDDFSPTFSSSPGLSLDVLPDPSYFYLAQAGQVTSSYPDVLVSPPDPIHGHCQIQVPSNAGSVVANRYQSTGDKSRSDLAFVAQFGSAAEAEAAFNNLLSQGTGCPQSLSAQGLSSISMTDHAGQFHLPADGFKNSSGGAMNWITLQAFDPKNEPGEPANGEFTTYWTGNKVGWSTSAYAGEAISCDPLSDEQNACAFPLGLVDATNRLVTEK